MDMIMILLCSTVSNPFPFYYLTILTFVQKTSGSQLSQQKILQTFRLPLFLRFSKDYYLSRAKYDKINDQIIHVLTLFER